MYQRNEVSKCVSMTRRATCGTTYQREAEVLEGLCDVVHVMRVRRSGSDGPCTFHSTHEGKESGE